MWKRLTSAPTRSCAPNSTVLSIATADALALRADMTIPVARLVATRLHDLPMPQRFCYAGSVFRYADTQAGMQREFWQAGVELIGAAEAAADAEVLAATVRALEVAGLPDVRLALGHLGYFHGLIAALALPERAHAAFVEAVDRNSEGALADFLRDTSLPENARTAVVGLPHLSGDNPDQLMERASSLCLNEAMRASLENLREILCALRGHGLDQRVIIDLTEIHNLGYYTGMTFEALSPRMGFAIASGGRYDHLVGTFGAPQPAVGAALILDRLLLALRPTDSTPHPQAPHLVVSTHGDARAYAVVQELRSAGFVVAVDLADRDARPLYDYAQSLGAPVALRWGNGSFQRVQGEVLSAALPSGSELASLLLREVRP